MEIGYLLLSGAVLWWAWAEPLTQKSRKESEMGAATTYVSKVDCKKCGSNVRYASSSNCQACAKLAAKNKKLITGPLRYLEASEYPVGRDAAAALRTRKFVPEAPCKHGHATLHDTRTGNCYQCRRRHKQRKPPAAKRRDPAILADRRARWRAEEDLQRKYLSPRGCPQCKTAAPERYVRGGACVTCASARGRRVYSASRPPAGMPGAWEAQFIRDNLREEDEEREAREVAAGKLPKKKKE
jgi:hypothetical protein